MVVAAGRAGGQEGLVVRGVVGAAEDGVVLVAEGLVGKGEEGEADDLVGEVGAGGGVVGGVEEEGELLVLVGDGVGAGEGGEEEDLVKVGGLTVVVQHLEGGDHLGDVVEVREEELCPPRVF